MSQRPTLSLPFSDAYIYVLKTICVFYLVSLGVCRGRDYRSPRFPFTRTQVCSWYYFKKQKSGDLFVPEPLCIFFMQEAGGLPGKPGKWWHSSLAPPHSELSLPPPLSSAASHSSFLTGSYFSGMLQPPSGTRHRCAFPPAICGNVPLQYLCPVQSVQVTIS